MIDITFARFSLTRLAGLAAAVAAMVVLAGCEMEPVPTHIGNYTSAAPAAAPVAGTPVNTNSMILHPGDTLKVSFPGAANMDAQTAIRLDGKISLPMVGEVNAGGMTPHDLEQEILRLAGDQLVVKQVSVSVVSSAFELYVEGAVLRPGKVTSDRMLTPLEALSDAGIDFQKANLKSVRVIRKEANGQSHTYKINVKKPLDPGSSTETFELKPYDIIYVPERFNWY